VRGGELEARVVIDLLAARSPTATKTILTGTVWRRLEDGQARSSGVPLAQAARQIV
jgi:hypothetical protein